MAALKEKTSIHGATWSHLGNKRQACPPLVPLGFKVLGDSGTQHPNSHNSALFTSKTPLCLSTASQAGLGRSLRLLITGTSTVPSLARGLPGSYAVLMESTGRWGQRPKSQTSSNMLQRSSHANLGHARTCTHSCTHTPPEGDPPFQALCQPLAILSRSVNPVLACSSDPRLAPKKTVSPGWHEGTN